MVDPALGLPPALGVVRLCCWFVFGGGDRYVAAALSDTVRAIGAELTGGTLTIPAVGSLRVTLALRCCKRACSRCAALSVALGLSTASTLALRFSPSTPLARGLLALRMRRRPRSGYNSPSCISNLRAALCGGDPLLAKLFGAGMGALMGALALAGSGRAPMAGDSALGLVCEDELGIGKLSTTISFAARTGSDLPLVTGTSLLDGAVLRLCVSSPCCGRALMGVRTWSPSYSLAVFSGVLAPGMARGMLVGVVDLGLVLLGFADLLSGAEGALRSSPEEGRARMGLSRLLLLIPLGKLDLSRGFS